MKDLTHPGVFPKCGCHYTTDDDGIHFCPLHHCAGMLQESLQELYDWAMALDGSAEFKKMVVRAHNALAGSRGLK